MSSPGSKYERSLVREHIADAEESAVRLMVDLIVDAAKQCHGLDLKLTPAEAERVRSVIKRLDGAAESARQLLERYA